MISSDREIETLERIHLSPRPVRQRDLARIIGLSLGMTNAILNRLARKGLLQIRKVNNRNIQYVVSAKGMEEIARRSYGYLKRTIKNVVYYKEAIDRLMAEVTEMGFRRLALIGSSDMDFIVEHLCTKHHLAFERLPAPPSEARSEGKAFLLYSENARQPNESSQDCASLRALFSTRPPAPERSGSPK